MPTSNDEQQTSSNAAAPALRSVTPIFFTSTFAVSLLLNGLITGVVNYFIDKHKLMSMWETPATKDKALVLVSNDSIADILVFTLIVALAAFFLNSPSLIRSIASGKLRPVSADALAVSPLYRVAGQRGKRTAVRFIVCSLLFPGVVVALALLAECRRQVGHVAPAVCYASTVDNAVYFMAAWKAVIAAIVHILNFTACHNDSQPELACRSVETTRVVRP